MPDKSICFPIRGKFSNLLLIESWYQTAQLMSKLDDNFDDYQYGKGNNTMVIHDSSMARDNSKASVLDMPRKYNEYRQQRGEDCR